MMTRGLKRVPLSDMPEYARKRGFKARTHGEARAKWWHKMRHEQGYSVEQIAKEAGYSVLRVKDVIKEHRNSVPVIIEESGIDEEDLRAALERPKWRKGDKIVKRTLRNGVREWCNISRYERCIEWIESNLRIADGSGRLVPMRLLDWQKEVVFELYAPIISRRDKRRLRRRGVISMARQNGKTEIVAALISLHLVGPETVPSKTILCSATTKDQAAILFDRVVVMMRSNPELVQRMKINVRSRYMRTLDEIPTDFKAIPSEVTAAHGQPTPFFVVDEYAQAKSDDLYNTLASSQGSFDEPLGIAISTLSQVPGNPMADLVREAKVNSDPQSPRYDPTWTSFVYAAEEGCELDDREQWAAANPSLGTSPKMDDMEAACRLAQSMPSQEAHFRVYRLNQSLGVFGGIVTQSQWLASIDEGFDLDALAGKRAFAGLDLSRNNALTSLALYWPDEQAFHTWSWMPSELVEEQAYIDQRPYPLYIEQGHLETTRGDTIDYRDVAMRMERIFEQYDIVALTFDPMYMDAYRYACDARNVELPRHTLPFYQGGRWESPAIEQFQHLIIDGHLRHIESPIDTTAIYQTTVRMSGGRPLLDKSNRGSSVKNDPIAATIFAIGIAMHWTDTSITHDWEERADTAQEVAELWA